MTIGNERQLEDVLSQPTAADIEAMRQLEGDLLILGVAGKMGPSLARRARRVADLGTEWSIVSEADRIAPLPATWMKRRLTGRISTSESVIWELSHQTLTEFTWSRRLDHGTINLRLGAVRRACIRSHRHRAEELTRESDSRTLGGDSSYYVVWWSAGGGTGRLRKEPQESGTIGA
ncbi:MAG: hypothetical protein WD696_10335 [Bryobacteraceae bacterium]